MARADPRGVVVLKQCVNGKASALGKIQNNEENQRGKGRELTTFDAREPLDAFVVRRSAAHFKRDSQAVRVAAELLHPTSEATRPPVWHGSMATSIAGAFFTPAIEQR
jgi:hypothetical protein